jgi:hypothetical protein
VGEKFGFFLFFDVEKKLHDTRTQREKREREERDLIAKTRRGETRERSKKNARGDEAGSAR